jgi:DNA polymerase elongation subunit (family B)
MTETIVAPKIIKKVVKTKSFRLFDFHIYDEFPHEIENGSGSESENDSNDGKHKPREKRQFVIQIFGINELGKTCCLYVMDYQPFFYVKVGDHWTNQTVRDLQNELVNRAEYHGKSIIEVVLEKHKKLYGFTSGKSYNFVKIVFQNSAAMNKVKNIWYGEKNGERVRVPFVFKNTTLELYESNIPPLLRYFHINNISPSGWIQILLHRVQTPKSKSTTCDFEYICTLTSIQPIPQKETPVPYKICSFDIEASSSHGDFPVPIKSYKRLATNLVDVFKNTLCSLTDTVQRTEHLKQMIHAAFGFGNYTDIDLVYPKYRPNEKELNKLFQIFLKMTIQNAKRTNTEENSRILTIDSIFEKHSEMEQGEGGGDGSDDDEPENIPKSYGKSTRSVGVESTITILDILTHASYDREQRIQFTNETLMSVFPKLEGDKVTFIGSTFMRYGDSLPYMNHCLVLGSCDEVEGAVIETTETENDLLLNWTKLIQKENPDIIIGYNIFGFDYEFMFRRAQENRCEREFLTLSRKRKEICAKVDKDSNECFIENTKVVLASGEYDLRYYKTSGRLQIDMYTYFRRDFNLPSYKLDDVAGQYISDDVKKVEFVTDNDGAIFTYLYTNNIAGLHVGNFIHIEISSFTSDYYRDGHKFVVIDIQPSTDSVSKYTITIEGHETDLHDHKKSIKWCMAKDDVSPQDIFRLSNGSSSDRAKVAKYCIQDCNLVHHLMNKIDVITGYVEMSRICSVPISFLVFRGQGIKLTSFVAKKCREKGTLMPDLEKSGENDGYEGAIVLPPKCSMYMDNPVACVDYSSLYPSSMISNNLSQDSKVWTKEYDLKGKLVKTTGEMDEKGNYIYDNLPEYQYVDVEFDTFRYVRKTPTSRAEKVKSGTKMCRWAQLPNNQKSIMPSILEELLKARSDTRKMIKTEKDPFMQNILDKRQLGYKVTANSLYGQCGARTSTFYEQDVAASTTSTGRLMITYAKRIIEEVYQDREYLTEKHGTVLTKAEYIYGDTDSVFFTFNLQDPKTGQPIRGKDALEITIEIAQDAARLCTEYLKPPMELTYEKTLMPFVLLSKKRYVGMLYETDANKGKLKYMGLSLKRRDSCDYLKDVYGEILNILMKENNIQKAIEYLDNALNDLIDSKVPMEKLMITRALRSDYKNPQQIAHKVLADRIGQRDPGNKPKPGDRIKFVFTQSNVLHKKTLMGNRIETPEFIKDNKLKIDYTHYITNQLMKPLQQLFGLAIEKIWEYQRKPGAIKTFKKDLAQLEKEFASDYELFMKRKEKYCSAKVKILLFDKILNKIANEKNGIQMITSFYK